MPFDLSTSENEIKHHVNPVTYSICETRLTQICINYLPWSTHIKGEWSYIYVAKNSLSSQNIDAKKNVLGCKTAVKVPERIG